MKSVMTLAALALVGCVTPAPSIVPSQTPLEQAQAKWSARGFSDYSFTSQTLCFCMRELTRLSRVEVRGGVVTQVIPLEGEHRDPLPANLLGAFRTVDQLFVRLEDDLPLRADSLFQDIQVDYHPTLGYPTRIQYLEKPIVADASATYTLSDVQPLE